MGMTRLRKLIRLSYLLTSTKLLVLTALEELILSRTDLLVLNLVVVTKLLREQCFERLIWILKVCVWIEKLCVFATLCSVLNLLDFVTMGSGMPQKWNW